VPVYQDVIDSGDPRVIRHEIEIALRISDVLIDCWWNALMRD